MKTCRVALLAAVLTVLAGCQAVDQVTHMFGDSDRPTVAIKKSSIVAMTEESVTMRFDIELTNHFDYSLPVWGIKYTMMSEGQELHSGNLSVETPLLPLSKRVIPIEVDLNFDELFAMLSEKGPGSVISCATIVDVAVDGLTGAKSLPSLKFVSKISVPGAGPPRPAY